MKHGVKKVSRIHKSVDKFTSSSSICNNKLFKEDTENDSQNKEERGQIYYWSLFKTRCNKDSRQIQSLRWVSQDDIVSASSTSTVAIPGVTIIALPSGGTRKRRH